MQYIIKDWKTFTRDGISPSDFLKSSLENEGINLCNHIVGALEYALKENISETVIMRLEHKQSDKLITVNKSDFKLVLGILLEFCELNEYYETCVDIRNLNENIEYGKIK